MASIRSGQRWSEKLRGGHVRLRWGGADRVEASLHGQLIDMVGTPIRARARGKSAETALMRLWQLVENVSLVPEPVQSDAQLEN